MELKADGYAGYAEVSHVGTPGNRFFGQRVQPVGRPELAVFKEERESTWLNIQMWGNNSGGPAHMGPYLRLWSESRFILPLRKYQNAFNKEMMSSGFNF